MRPLLGCLLILVAFSAPSRAGDAARSRTDALMVRLHDLDTTEGLRGSGTVAPCQDAAQGEGSVRWSVEAGTKHGLTFDFAGRGLEAAEWDELRFRYKVVKGGWTWFGVKLVDHPIADGMQATWRLGGAEAFRPDGWREGVVDLARPMYRWGERPDRERQWLCFRAMADRPAAILLDDVRLARAALRIQVIERATGRQADGSRYCRWHLRLANPTDVVRRVRLTVDARGLRTFRLRPHPESLTLQAKEHADVEIRLVAKPGRLAEARPLTTERAVLHCRVDAEPEPLDTPLELRAVVPLACPDPPFLLVTAQEIDAIKEKAARHPWAKKALEALLRQADAARERPLHVPSRGSQWWHWYSCPRCGARLKTLSPTEHRCPTCGKVYSGEPYDSVVLARDHSRNARDIETLGLAHQLTGHAPYAAKARDLLLRYAELYLTFPRHDKHGRDRLGGGRVGPQTLDESTWLIPVVRGYDLVRHALTPAQRQAVESRLLRPAAELIMEHKIGIHNIQCWKNSAVGLVGLCLDEPRFLADAVNSPRGIHQQLAEGILDDGSWYEGSWGYHWYTMSALWPLAEALRHAGLDVYTERYRGLYAAPLHFALPNGLLPAFNDSHEGNATGQWRRYELAYARWRDPLFAAVLEGRPRTSRESLLFGVPELDAAAELPHGSRCYPVSGYAYLQCDPGPDGPVAILDAAPHGGGHGHPEKLQIVLYAAGRILAPDPGCIHYGVPLHREWYRETIAHNTVTVDRRAQRPCRGQFRLFHATPELACASASADAAYEGVRFARTVALVPGGVLFDLTELASDAAHTFDWAFHVYGQFHSPLSLEDNLAPPGKANGYQHIRDSRGGRFDTALHADWAGEQSSLSLVTLRQSGSEVFHGVGHGQPPARPLPTWIVRRQGKAASFLSAFRITAGAPRPIALEAGPAAKGRVRLIASVDQERIAVLLPATLDGPFPQASGKALPPPLTFETDARVAAVRLAGDALRAIALCEARALRAGPVAIATSAPATLSLSVRPDGADLLFLEGDETVEVSIAGLYPARPIVTLAGGEKAETRWAEGTLTWTTTPGRTTIAPPPAAPAQKRDGGK